MKLKKSDLHDFSVVPGPLTITLVYCLVGVLWVLFSDKFLLYFVDDPHWITQLQTFKGWFYIMITALLVYYLVKRYHVSAMRFAQGIRRGEQALRDSEERYRELVEDAGSIILRLDTEGRITFINRFAQSFFGFSETEILGRPVVGTIVPETDSEGRNLHDFISDLVKSPEKYGTHENENIRQNGKRVWISWTNRAVYDDQKRIREVLCVGNDVTERKRAEEALSRSETKFRRLYESAPLAYQSLNEDGFILEVNSTWLQKLGYEKDEVIGRWFGSFIRPSQLDHFGENFPCFKSAGEIHGVEFDMVRRDGAIISVSFDGAISRSPGGAFEQTHCIFSDITDRKRSEERLRESERRFRELLETVNLAAFMVDQDGRITFCNEFLLSLSGWSDQEVLGRDWFQMFLLPEDHDFIRHGFEEAVRSGLIPKHMETIIQTRQGGRRLIQWNNTLLQDEGDRVIGAASIGQDITETKQYEQKLSLLAAAMEQFDEGVYITDDQGGAQYVNQAFETISGYTKDEIMAGEADFFIGDRPLREVSREPRETIDHDQAWKGLVVNRRKDGSLYEAEMSVSPVRDDAGRITNFVAVKRDVTRERFLERQLRQAQKMEAIGALAGGIAHDFNNILGAIMGYAEMALMDMPPDSASGRNMEQVLKAGNRARELVKQILAFSRRTEMEKRPIGIAPIVKEGLKLIRASVPSTIEIRQFVRSDIGAVMADPTQIHQVLMNLCTNAAYAMRDSGGILGVNLTRVEVDPDHAAVHLDLKPGPYVLLSVSDTGHGIPADIMERIFEPFFTTKHGGEGTGMGLAVMHGIVRSHDGAINVYSEPGQGSTFNVYLPMIAQPEETPAPQTGPIPTGTESILLVDDEEPLLDLGRQILARLGYKVHTRNNPSEAFEFFRSEPAGVDLVITDYTMPKMTGVELSKRLLQIRPDLPIILCTGFNQAINEETARAVGIRAFLMKPFVGRELGEMIRSVLDET